MHFYPYRDNLKLISFLLEDERNFEVSFTAKTTKSKVKNANFPRGGGGGQVHGHK